MLRPLSKSEYLRDIDTATADPDVRLPVRTAEYFDEVDRLPVVSIEHAIGHSIEHSFDMTEGSTANPWHGLPAALGATSLLAILAVILATWTR